MREPLTRLASALGVARISRELLFPNACFAIEFHGVAEYRRADLPLDVQPNMVKDELRRVLEWLQERFQFLTHDQFMQTSLKGILLTFDDGFANNYSVVLPLLEEFGAPAIFFVSTQHVVEPTDWLPTTRQLSSLHWRSQSEVPDHVAVELFNGMSVEQLKACDKNPLVTIGSHTVSHPRLTECPTRQLESELVDSRAWLAEVTGEPVELLAYPYGDYDRRVAEAVRSAGYNYAFVEDSLHVGVPDFEIPRIGIYDASRSYLDVKLSGLHRRPSRLR